MLDPVSLFIAFVTLTPVFGLVIGLYAKQTRKSREALIDRHNAELATRDSMIAGRELDLRALSGQVQTLDARLKLAQELQVAFEKLKQLPPPERRADPSLADNSYELIPLSKAAEFYDRVAHLYNKRNTGKYLTTYIEIYKAIVTHLENIEGARICDLGGGTGFLLHRLQQHAVQWLNVDISRGALRVFEADFSFYANKDLRNLDVGRDRFITPGEVFDIIVMSYLWSSMDGSPDLDQVRLAMQDTSLLVVADNHASYVDDNRHYGFTVDGGKNLAIAPRPMVPSELRSLVTLKGFVEVAFKEIAIDGKPYSQLHVFRKGT